MTCQPNNIADLLAASRESIYPSASLLTRDFVHKESWSSIVGFESRIAKVGKTEIICDCLVDKTNEIFESRTFPKTLFESLSKLEVGAYVFLQIKIKPGSTRIDVLGGAGLVDEKIFVLRDKLLEEDVDFSVLENRI